ncbi:MAG: histidine--tRNA ligase [Rhizomicrobium sp.]
MSDSRPSRPKARLPRGLRDRGAAEIVPERSALEAIRLIFESYGFSALETPAFEFTDALGKFLPDVDRPNEGVFSLKDDDGQWLSLRYDLTAPLARHVAAHFQDLPKPFRRYQVGSVWRNEKPGPGRYREFLQFDADTVGSASPAADAELLMMLADALEAVGLDRGDYRIKLNSRKLLDTVLKAARVQPSQQGIVLRAMDKFDRLGEGGVRALLGEGRKDESGDFTKGASLAKEQADLVMELLTAKTDRYHGTPAIQDLWAIKRLVEQSGYADDRVQIDTGVVRGLDYYTGAVFEAQLTFPVPNAEGSDVVFGSVAGGGRYDDLVARFTGQTVPATGVSIGVSRLISVLSSRGLSRSNPAPLVVVTVMDKAEIASSFKMAAELRSQGLRAETYVGNGKFGDQMKYADRRGALVAVIEGSEERAKGSVTLKNLTLGSELARSAETRTAWVGTRQAQVTVKREDLLAEVRKMLERG